MKRFALCLLLATPAHAQFYFANSNLWVTTQERLRVEYRSNNYTFDSSVSADTDTFLLQRARLGLGAKACDWFKVYGELQDAREEFSQRDINGTNPNIDEDTIDWRQGWVELANYQEFPVGLKIGRQELSYGDERLIGAFDWSNVGRVFDSVKARWQAKQCWVDFFYANVVNNNVTSGNDNSFDDHTYWQDHFYGLYGHTAAVPNHSWDLYGLYRNKTDAQYNGPAREIYTLGTRFESTAKMKPWDYYAEVAGQFGHIDGPGGKFFGQTTSNSVSQCALAAVVGGGYAFDVAWKPRLGLEYNYASGDSDPNDDVDGTFDNLYPTNHKFYGFMDLFSWKNVHNPHATLSVVPLKNLTLQLDGNLFWLAESRDSWYRANQQQIRRDATGNANTFVGSEIDFTASYTFHKRVRLQAGYSHFFTGDFVADTGTHSDADFAYGQITLSL